MIPQHTNKTAQEHLDYFNSYRFAVFTYPMGEHNIALTPKFDRNHFVEAFSGRYGSEIKIATHKWFYRLSKENQRYIRSLFDTTSIIKIGEWIQINYIYFVYWIVTLVIYYSSYESLFGVHQTALNQIVTTLVVTTLIFIKPILRIIGYGALIKVHNRMVDDIE